MFSCLLFLREVARVILALTLLCFLSSLSDLWCYHITNYYMTDSERVGLNLLCGVDVALIYYGICWNSSERHRGDKKLEIIVMDSLCSRTEPKEVWAICSDIARANNVDRKKRAFSSTILFYGNVLLSDRKVIIKKVLTSSNLLY